MNNEVEKVIVTVHGVGDQTRFATLQQTVSQFCQYHGEVAAVPLGNFHTVGTLPATSPGTLPGTPPPMPALVLSAPYPSELRKFAFAEVYWADIARKVAEEKYTLEDVAPWVRTIVSRVRMNDLSSQKLTADDQRRIEQVLGEMLQTISVLERLWSWPTSWASFRLTSRRSWSTMRTTFRSWPSSETRASGLERCLRGGWRRLRKNSQKLRSIWSRTVRGPWFPCWGCSTLSAIQKALSGSGTSAAL